MKVTSLLLAWAFIFCLSFQSFGQKTTRSNTALVKTYAHYKNQDPSLSHLNYFEAMADKMHLSAQSKMEMTEESAGKNGYTHFKYQQFHEGLPIFGSRYILHEKEGKVVTATGHYSPQASAASKPGINPTTAVAFAKQDMDAREYDARATEPILCFIDPAFPKVSETLRLAYQVDLHSTRPFDKQRYFVDAATGKVIAQFPLLLEEGVPSTGKTKYYGIQNIITDSMAPQEFVLRDLTRGDGIHVTNGNNGGSYFTDTSSTWDLTNAQMDEVALDAHFCTQEYYDMMLADYGWQGQDGNGKALNARVHDGAYVNAFWDGVSSYYGDGDCNNGPLTTLEVIGHEFTHGMIDYTSKLVYDAESGAINESLADMFGKLLERKTDPANFSWNLGHSFMYNPDGIPFRVMDDPNSLQMPALYKGIFWQDFNDVHINSSIGNLWFSMLVDGRQGINELGTAFDVPALGVDKTGQIVFETNKNYLVENSDYNAFYQSSVEVAEALYGLGSAEALSVAEAWKAVGLPTAPSTAFDLIIVSTGDPFSNAFCDIGGYVPVKFKVINSSTVAYDPSMMATVTLSSFQLPDYTVNLTSPIGPGEVFEIEVNDWLQATDPGSFAVDAHLDLIDENLDNNMTFAYYDVYEFESDDLSLYAYFDEKDCFATVQNVNIFIQNWSCEAVPAGTVLNFTGADAVGNILWASGPYTLTAELLGNGYLFLDFEIPAANPPAVFTLLHPSDPDPANNFFEVFTQFSYLPITGNYLNNFETNGGQDDYLEIYGIIGSAMFYQSSNYFASTGDTQDPELFERCQDPLAVFNSQYAEGLNTSIHTCVDFSFSAAPTLEFDLVEFRNAFLDPPNYQHSSMLQAKWTGNQSGNQIIFGQPEGVAQHHNLALPPYFKGALDLKFYTELGNGELLSSLLDDYDFVLLDNLKLSAPTSGTDDLAVALPIFVSPNPARDMVTVRAADGIKTILLQNLSGQTLQTLQVNATAQDLDLSRLANGFYLLNIQLENGQWGAKKLAKMD